MAKIEDYAAVTGQPVIDDLRRISEKLAGKNVRHVNSTAVGGGVAEILNRMVPLLNELGVESQWDVIKGGEEFFNVTKKFHNAIHGSHEKLTRRDFDLFMETGRANMASMKLDGDIIYIHDPQPIVLVEKKQQNKWIWRCHIDASNPQQDVWEFLMQFIMKFDAAVFSAPSFTGQMAIRQFLIAPSIDPLSEKNRELSAEEMDSVMRKYSIPEDKPLVTQISRFDRLKDPLGVIEAYKKVKKNVDCRLLLAGGGASDDPEGAQVLAEVQEMAKNDPDIIVLLMPHDEVAVNAIQRRSTVIVQKSLKEGFGLTVSEALWKGKPVVASAVGGIPLQVAHKYSGMLCHSIDGAAFAIKQLLSNPAYARKLGENGREHVRNNFLITRHLKEYILLFLSLYHNEDVVSL
ncbi:MAG: glycosyltransferase [Spirochaetia bacterium]|nr:glycosyltransferase [Spirochaetia bacterium]